VTKHTGTVAAVVLAAGGGKRFGGQTSKVITPFAGRPVVQYALDAAVASGLGPVVLVVGRDADVVCGCATPGVEIVRNERWAEGISTSLGAALRTLAARGVVHAAVVGLADQPLVGAEAWRRVGAAYDAGAPLAVATYAGIRGNPVLLGRAVWTEALALTGDEGARQLMRTHDIVEVACDGTGEPTDIDTPDDLVRLEATWRRSPTASE
jgi:CTP:molybdopterin cytidylyltransferase MocA